MAKICKIYNVLIIGAGAAGLFLAANLRGKSVALLEKNASGGKKILASGGGRCNVTNRRIDASNYLGDANFVKNILKNLDFKDVLNFFGELKFNEQKQNQFFCESGAKDVLGVLLKRARQSGAQIFCGVCVKGARKISTDENGGIADAFSALDGDKFEGSCRSDAPNLQNVKRNLDEIFEVVAENGDKFYAKNLVVASGGLSYKSLGASDVGYEIARSFGIKVVPPTPALVGFTVQKEEFWFKNLSGVCFPAQILLERAPQKSGDDSKSYSQSKSGDADVSADKFSARRETIGANLRQPCDKPAPLQTNDLNPQKAVTFATPRQNGEIELNLTANEAPLDKNREFYESDAKFNASQEIEFNGGEILNGDAKAWKSSQKKRIEIAGDVLFTHKGISGPAVLNASLFWQKGLIEINFCPNFSIETAQKSKKQLSTVLPLPRRFTLEFLRAAGLSDKPYSKYSQAEREKILRLFSYRFAPAGTFGFERAEVTKGGVDTDALEADCGVKGVRGLYFIGEVLNVTGMLGGYNLHFAFACAQTLAERLNAK
nr:NAD(P)/FAD-dependent oxidoreductase [uncultured Campylobacter sp.]